MSAEEHTSPNEQGRTTDHHSKVKNKDWVVHASRDREILGLLNLKWRKSLLSPEFHCFGPEVSPLRPTGQ